MSSTREMKPDLPDVDTLIEMAQEDPERLELLRRSMMAALIDSAPNEQIKKRLRGLRFKIDMERERAKTPMDACITLSEMMHESLAELHRALVDPQERETNPEKADVVEFPKNND
ncbi:MAG: DUF3135 domain-containing protein [Gammaproteobacteria bacterium]|nr:DUF3135 domain-containing protein [Gammaproteobacteria bacterium]